LANSEHLAILKQGPCVWNPWREQNAHVEPDLAGASLPDENLGGANLQLAKLRGADLRGANLTGCNLTAADLREANLKNADLTGARGLERDRLAGADLTGCTLPTGSEANFEDAEAARRISDNAQKLFIAMLVACLYSWLTIATTTDASLITNHASTPLPIIQASIPIVGFYVVAPLLLLGVYFYCHFYLQKLWEELGSLPAIFPDGRPLQTKADPWLLSDLVRAHVQKLRAGRPFLSYLQQWVSELLAWWCVPMTLVLFWARYLPRHDLRWTMFHSVLVVVSIVSGVLFYQVARCTLRGADRPPFDWRSAIASPRTRIVAGFAAISTLAMVTVSLGAIMGVRPSTSGSHCGPSLSGLRTWVPRAMAWVGYLPFADVSAADLSVKPQNWTKKSDADLESAKGLQLPGANLRYADLSFAFLPVTVLSDAKLQGADLLGADLRQTQLSGAHLEGADLAGADLTGADLAGAFLNDAVLRNADLTDADLTNADIRYADFQGTKGLTANHLSRTKNLGDAFFDDSVLADLNLGRPDSDKLPSDNNTRVLARRNVDGEKNATLAQAACEAAQLARLTPGKSKAAGILYASLIVQEGGSTEVRTVLVGKEGSFSVPQLAQLYDFPTRLDGQGQTIGILEFGGGYKLPDLKEYFIESKLPMPNVSFVSVDGKPNSQQNNALDLGDTAEVELNIEIVGAVAPRANIVVYFTNFDQKGWIDAINTVTHDTVHRPGILLITWGYSEDAPGVWSQPGINAINSALQSAAASGITVVVASGDDGAGNQQSDGHAHVDFPASSPWVLAVGGTKLTANAGAIASETAWNDEGGTRAHGGGASGGGVSVFFPRPSWQAAVQAPQALAARQGRAIPDVAADASTSAGYELFFSGSHQVNGGTAASASLWAGLLALLNQGLGRNVGYINPVLYSQLGPEGILRSVTPGGTNGGAGVNGYPCGPGWNACSGWGTPDGRKLLEALKANH